VPTVDDHNGVRVERGAGENGVGFGRKGGQHQRARLTSRLSVDRFVGQRRRGECAVELASRERQQRPDKWRRGCSRHVTGDERAEDGVDESRCRSHHGSHQVRHRLWRRPAVGSVVFVATDNDCVAAICGDSAPTLRSAGSPTGLVPTASVVSSCFAVASCLASATVDIGAGVLVFVGSEPAGLDPSFVVGLPVGPSLTAVSVGDASVADGVGSRVSPPVPTTKPGGAERSSSSFVTEPLVPVDSAAPCAALGLAVAGSVPEVVLEAVDPGVPPESSAHAGPLPHPVTMAAPTPKVTAKPPTRLTYALAGMRYV
jgi:hypothetical protein